MLLQEKLDDMRAASRAKYGEEIAGVMKRATNELRASSIVERALKVGDLAPSFSLPNQEGEVSSTRDLLARGALVVSFTRGVW